ncbi:pilus assembly protein PilM [Marinicella sediminis]|uniref:Pilus assembly protein PilM n=1 Tax=Marinicella sediminis TaxID=1792834 RepID=A0ABV7J4Z9_9GAMM|nr:pilus assembly protein PilM [Marinicella sediminis]
MTSYVEKITEPLSQWYQTSSIHAFFEWWVGELKSFVPERHRKKIFANTNELFIYQSGEEVELWQQTEQQMQRLQPDGSVADKEWWHQLNHQVAGSDQEARVTYLVSEKLVLGREIALPTAVMSDIESVLTFELDKYIPFKADDVDFAFRKGPVEEGSEKFPVMLTAIRKQNMREIIELTESKGIRLSAVDVNTGTAEQPVALGMNLLPREWRKKKDWTAIKWYAGLLLVAVLLLAFVMYGSLENKTSKIASLEAQVTELRKDARRAKMIETQLNESVQAANFLGDLKIKIPSRVMMVAELTEKIPQNTYLTRIVIDEEKMEVVGQSTNANALVPILNQSELWYEPQIIGNVTQDPRTGKEKFTIRSALKLEVQEEADNES